ncbi:hypothetical protein AZH53_08705 [Methanomicrobiaceae archaeon CYW5]|uniref:PKD domain-containing protein n=1 Tax=Methanovulcanius yangii TaxID=1789227 RepID=UPI0029CA2F07|nr:PKD domain-containing protein [Methanovulcanius yangii]MBT8508484.1 hypothetical protein [Methanovulcanius yangii]
MIRRITILCCFAGLLCACLCILPALAAGEDAPVDFAAIPVTGPPPLQVTFSAFAPGADTWDWTFGDGTGVKGSTPEKEVPVHTYLEPGVYTVTLTAYAGNAYLGTEKKEAYIVVSGGGITPSSTEPGAVNRADFSATPKSGPAPLTVYFQGTNAADVRNGWANEWVWDFGDTYLLPEERTDISNPVHTYTFPGLYTVSLTIKGTGGREDAVVKKDFIVVGGITPVTPLEIPPDFVAEPLNGTAPLTVQFTSSAPGADRWAWDFGDGNGSVGNGAGEEHPAHTYTTPGTYTVRMSVWTADAYLAMVEKEGYITVDAAPPTPTETLPTKTPVGTPIPATTPCPTETPFPAWMAAAGLGGAVLLLGRGNRRG